MIIWIVFEVIWAYQKSTIEEVDKISLEPISEELHLDLANLLLQKQQVSQQEIDTFLLESNAPKPTPTIVPTPPIEASSSGQLNP